jgi:hypothetical protein
MDKVQKHSPFKHGINSVSSNERFYTELFSPVIKVVLYRQRNMMYFVLFNDVAPHSNHFMHCKVYTLSPSKQNKDGMTEAESRRDESLYYAYVKRKVSV